MIPPGSAQEAWYKLSTRIKVQLWKSWKASSCLSRVWKQAYILQLLLPHLCSTYPHLTITLLQWHHTCAYKKICSKYISQQGRGPSKCCSGTCDQSVCSMHNRRSVKPFTRFESGQKAVSSTHFLLRQQHRDSLPHTCTHGLGGGRGWAVSCTPSNEWSIVEYCGVLTVTRGNQRILRWTE